MQQQEEISYGYDRKGPWVTYPTCAWSHSPWRRSNTRGTWLVTIDATTKTTQSLHVDSARNCNESMQAARAHAATHRCEGRTETRRMAKEREIGTERDSRLWQVACTPCNRHRWVMWLPSGTTILVLHPSPPYPLPTPPADCQTRQRPLPAIQRRKISLRSLLIGL